MRASPGTPGTWSYTAADGTVVNGSGQAPQPAQAPVEITSTVCPTSMDGYKPGETTMAEVEHCLGKSTHQYHNERDGTYGDIYNLPGGDVYLFQFDRSKTLLNVRKGERCLNPPCVVTGGGP